MKMERSVISSGYFSDSSFNTLQIKNTEEIKILIKNKRKLVNILLEELIRIARKEGYVCNYNYIMELIKYKISNKNAIYILQQLSEIILRSAYVASKNYNGRIDLIKINKIVILDSGYIDIHVGKYFNSKSRIVNIDVKIELLESLLKKKEYLAAFYLQIFCLIDYDSLEFPKQDVTIEFKDKSFKLKLGKSLYRRDYLLCK